MTSRLASGQPLAGEGLLTDALASVFVGATVLKEAKRTCWVTFFGALMIALISNGLILMNATYYLQNVAKCSDTAWQSRSLLQRSRIEHLSADLRNYSLGGYLICEAGYWQNTTSLTR